MTDADIGLLFTNDLQYPNVKYNSYKSLQEELAKVPILKEAWSKAKKMSSDQSDKAVAKRAYILDESPLYNMCNDLLKKCFESSEDSEELSLNNYVKLLEMQCEKLNTETIVYKGVSRKQQLEVENYKYVMTKQFLSCLLDKATGETIAQNDGILYIIKTKFAIKFTDDSHQNGNKYVIPPGVFLRITSIKSGPSYTEVELQLVEAVIHSAVNSSLVLDSQRPNVILQKFSKSDAQLWFIQGRYIRKISNGQALDINKPFCKGSQVIIWPLHCKENQEWFWDQDKSVRSGKEQLVLDIDITVQEGASLMAWTKHGKDNQKFGITDAMDL